MGKITRLHLGPVSVNMCPAESFDEAATELLRSGSPAQIVTLNALMFNCALASPPFSRLLSESALAVADSAGIVWAIRILTGQRYTKMAGIDLIDNLCRLALRSNLRIFLLGAKPGVADVYAHRLQERFPALTIAGVHHGFFAPDAEAEVIAAIRETRPHILLVALAMPEQEYWIHRNLQKLPVPLVMGVGGSFDVISGSLRRAPQWMRRSGLEWLYRLMQEPWRIGRISQLVLFVLHILRLRAVAVFRSASAEDR